MEWSGSRMALDPVGSSDLLDARRFVLWVSTSRGEWSICVQRSDLVRLGEMIEPVLQEERRQRQDEDEAFMSRKGGYNE